MADPTIDDFLNSLPLGPLGPQELGLQPPPMAPQMPVSGETPEAAHQRKMHALAGLAATLIGGKSSIGAGAAVIQHQQQIAGERKQQEARDQQLFNQQQQQFQREQAAYDNDVQQRQQRLMTSVDIFRRQVPSITNKATYDQQVEGFAQLMQRAGYRVDANWLRQAAPYIKPNAKKAAQDLLDRWTAKNQASLDADPSFAETSVLPFDRDGDGVDERVSIKDLRLMAGLLATDPKTGEPIYAKPKTSAVEAKATAGGLLEQYIAKAKAEGKDVSPGSDTMIALTKQAMEDAKDASTLDKAPDPVLEEMRQLRLEQMKQGQGANLSPQTQRRVDAKVKGFDAQAVVKRIVTQADAVTFINSMDVHSTNPADDQALIYAFAKAMDPESVVREGEYQVVQKYSQSWLEKFGFNAKRVVENSEFLTPQARQNMKATIEKRFAATKIQYDNLKQSYGRQIERMTGQPGGTEWLNDYEDAFPGGAANPTPTTTKVPTVAPGAYQRYMEKKGAK